MNEGNEGKTCQLKSSGNFQTGRATMGKTISSFTVLIGEPVFGSFTVRWRKLTSRWSDYLFSLFGCRGEKNHYTLSNKYVVTGMCRFGYRQPQKYL